MHIDEIKSAHRRTGGYFFEPSNMRFFNSRTLSDVYEGAGGVYFITSEKYKDEPRKYTIRSFNKSDSSINTMGEYNSIPTPARAKTIAQKLAAGI